MHPRNRYRDNKPDFYELAQHRPSLMPYLIQKNKLTPASRETTPHSHTLDFSDPNALRELTCALLSKDFSLDVVLPVDRLVPMVTQRLNYIHWVEDLLVQDKERQEDSEKQEGDKKKSGEHVYAIDIGTGTSCIYPLLGTATNRDWHFLATETDDISMKYALDNVQRNNLQERINVLKVSPDTMLVGAICKTQQYHFVMCNPPFYTDNKERFEGTQRTPHRPAPPTFNTGCEQETVTEGGEVGFVRQIIHDSLILRSQIMWYTSMLGKKLSLKIICQELKQHQVPVVTSTRFVQGKTHRWAVAWTFNKTLSHKVKQDSCVLLQQRKHRKQSHPLSLSISCSVGKDETRETALHRVTSQLKSLLKELQIEFKEEEIVEGESEDLVRRERRLVCEAHKNTWSQQRKRRRLKQRLQTQTKSGGCLSDVLTADITVRECGNRVKGKAKVGSKAEKTIPTYDKSICFEDGKNFDETSVCGKQTVTNTDLQSSPTSALAEGAMESLGSERGIILQQIETLNTPCYIQFSCIVQTFTEESTSDVMSPSSLKKTRPTSPKNTESHASETGGEGGPRDNNNNILLMFEWIEGDNKDLLHQIVQYIKNTNL